MAHKNKTALVTGAGGGLGREIAEAFLREGANVVVCDIRDDLIKDFEKEVSAAYPKCALMVKCDITSESALDDLFAQAEKMFGHLDYVVNSAGMMDRFDPVGEMDMGMWNRVIALNLTAPAMVTKRAVNAMMKANVKGSIVNIASVAGVRGFTSGAAYTASKHGLLGLTKNTAVFYGLKGGIRCNAIMAGGMRTNIFAHLGSDINMEGYTTMRKTFAEDNPGSMVDIDKVAATVLYLCSDAGEIFNGSCLTADGGMTAN